MKNKPKCIAPRVQNGEKRADFNSTKVLLLVKYKNSNTEETKSHHWTLSVLGAGFLLHCTTCMLKKKAVKEQIKANKKYFTKYNPSWSPCFSSSILRYAFSFTQNCILQALETQIMLNCGSLSLFLVPPRKLKTQLFAQSPFCFWPSLEVLLGQEEHVCQPTG